MDVIVVVYLVVDIWLFKFVNKIVGEIWKYFQKLVIFVVNKVDLVRGCVVLIKGMFIIFFNFKIFYFIFVIFGDIFVILNNVWLLK